LRDKDAFIAASDGLAKQSGRSAVGVSLFLYRDDCTPQMVHCTGLRLADGVDSLVAEFAGVVVGLHCFVDYLRLVQTPQGADDVRLSLLRREHLSEQNAPV
jgi:hypothetical protein